MPENSGQRPTADGDAVYPSLEDDGYADPLALEKPIPFKKDAAVPRAVHQNSAQGARVGAKPIKWSWWALALSVSLLLWLGIAKLFGWF